MWNFNEDIAIYDNDSMVLVRRIRLIQTENGFTNDTVDIYTKVKGNKFDEKAKMAEVMAELEKQVDKEICDGTIKNLRTYRKCDYCHSLYPFSDPRSMYCCDNHKQYAKQKKRKEREKISR